MMKNYTKDQILEIWKEIESHEHYEYPQVFSTELNDRQPMMVAVVVVEKRGPVRKKIGDNFYSYIFVGGRRVAILGELVEDQLYHVLGYVDVTTDELVIPKLTMVPAIKWTTV